MLIGKYAPSNLGKFVRGIWIEKCEVGKALTLFLIIKRLTIDIEVMGYYSIALDFIASVTKMQKVNKLQIVLLSSIDF